MSTSLQFLDGYFSDASRMFKIGTVSERAERIVRVTEECVELGLKAAKLGDTSEILPMQSTRTHRKTGILS